MIQGLKQLAKQIHENAVNKGFYDRSSDPLFEQHQVYEIAKEIAEFHEAYKVRVKPDKAYNKVRSTPDDVYLEDYPENIGQEKNVFETLIKDTYQDELADVVIRCLDYLEYKGNAEYLHDFNIVDTKISDYGISAICADLNRSALDFDIGDVVIGIKHLSNLLGVDLLWHIKAKMAYNATRQKLHGKNF